MKHLQLFEEFDAWIKRKKKRDRDPENDWLIRRKKKKRNIPGGRAVNKPIETDFKVGDEVYVINKNRGGLSENAFKYLNSADKFIIRGITKTSKLDIGYQEGYGYSPNRFSKDDPDNLDFMFDDK